MGSDHGGVGDHTDVEGNHPDTQNVDDCTDEHEHEQHQGLEAILRRKDIEQFEDRLFHGCCFMGVVS